MISRSNGFFAHQPPDWQFVRSGGEAVFDVIVAWLKVIFHGQPAEKLAWHVAVKVVALPGLACQSFKAGRTPFCGAGRSGCETNPSPTQ
jgi:hypothetical protein